MTNNKESLQLCLYRVQTKSKNITAILNFFQNISAQIQNIVSKNVNVKLVSGTFFEEKQEYFINLTVDEFYTTNLFVFRLSFKSEKISVLCMALNEGPTPFIPIEELEDKIENYLCDDDFISFVGGFSAVADFVKSQNYTQSQEEPK